MATPHIAGLIAYLISANGGCKIAPADMIEMIQALGQGGALFGVREYRSKLNLVIQVNHTCSTSNKELLGAKSLVTCG